MELDHIASLEILEIKTLDGPAGKDTLRIQRFQKWLRKSTHLTVDRLVLLEFGSEVATHGVLADLEKSILGYISHHKDFKVELRAAVTDHSRRIRRKKMRCEILQAKWWRPFLPHVNMDKLHIHEINRVDEWLKYLNDHGISAPTSKDYIAFAGKWDTEVPLVALQTALSKLAIPKVPSIEIELNIAISTLRTQRVNAERKVRTEWPLKLSVGKNELPAQWRDFLDHIKTYSKNTETPLISSGFLPTIETALRTLCFCCRKLDIPCAITKQTALHLLDELKARGARYSTMEINISALKRFAVAFGVPAADVADLRRMEKELTRKRNEEIPQKFKKLTELGSLQAVLGLATDLLAAARSEMSLELRMAKLNAATALAVFTLVPLRAADSNLTWGDQLTYTGMRYHLDLRTSKCGTEFHGDLCDFITPFLDAILLRGCDDRLLGAFRSEAVRTKRMLFAHANGRHVSKDIVANLWSRHLGCGPHIARTVVHTELGKLGSSGVEMALSLCAQRDPRTARFYQGKAMHDALLLESNGILLSGFSNTVIAKHFTEIEEELMDLEMVIYSGQQFSKCKLPKSHF
jgi:hypothetical protein